MRRAAPASAVSVLSLALGGMVVTIWAKDYWKEKSFAPGTKMRPEDPHRHFRPRRSL